jgi:hypothetical protein
VRALVFAPTPQRARWIESELDRDGAVLQVGRTMANIVSALVEDPAPYPSLLVVDFDATSASDVLRLHAVRDRGWCGTIVGIGDVPAALRTSLTIDHVLKPPFVRDSLRDAIRHLRAATMQLPVMR